MELAAIIGFVALGVALIILEVIFVPGTTIVGIGGLVCCSYGIYLSFESYGSTGGFITIALSAAFGFGALLYSFKNRSWERFSLKQTIDSSVNEEQISGLKIGDLGESISALKPIGKAIFEDEEYEVTSKGGWISEHIKIRIIGIENHKILVEKDSESGKST